MIPLKAIWEGVAYTHILGSSSRGSYCTETRHWKTLSDRLPVLVTQDFLSDIGGLSLRTIYDACFIGLFWLSETTRSYVKTPAYCWVLNWKVLSWESRSSEGRGFAFVKHALPFHFCLSSSFNHERIIREACSMQMHSHFLQVVMQTY